MQILRDVSATFPVKVVPLGKASCRIFPQSPKLWDISWIFEAFKRGFLIHQLGQTWIFRDVRDPGTAIPCLEQPELLDVSDISMK